jgi:hypothetical protein
MVRSLSLIASLIAAAMVILPAEVWASHTLAHVAEIVGRLP